MGPAAVPQVRRRGPHRPALEPHYGRDRRDRRPPAGIGNGRKVADGTTDQLLAASPRRGATLEDVFFDLTAGHTTHDAGAIR